MALPGDEAPAGIALSKAPKVLKPADHDKVAIFQGRDSIWIPGNDKYHMKKPALNNRTKDILISESKSHGKRSLNGSIGQKP